MRDFVIFFALQCVNFLIVTVNYRAVAHEQYVAVALTDATICLISFTLLKRIASAEGWPSRLGYAAGGTCGALIGMYVTRMWA